MMCSTNMTVRPSLCRSRSRSIIGARSAGTSPASTSSSRISARLQGKGPGQLETLESCGGQAARGIVST